MLIGQENVLKIKLSTFTTLNLPETNTKLPTKFRKNLLIRSYTDGQKDGINDNVLG